MPNDPLQPKRSDETAPTAPLRLGVTFGTTPGKWLRIWHERFPERPIALTALPEDSDASVLASESLDAALLRADDDSPLAPEHNRVRLYRESLALVVQREHPFAELTQANAADLVDVALASTAHARRWLTQLDSAEPINAAQINDESHTTREVMALAATGSFVGVTTQPAARATSRRDTVTIPLADCDGPDIVLVWPRGDDSEIQELLGIMRGRRANSSRGKPAESTAAASQRGVSGAGHETRIGATKRGGPRSTSGNQPRRSTPTERRSRKRR